MIPKWHPGTGPASLAVAPKPFETMADPAREGPFKVPNFEMAQGLTLERLGDRKGLLTAFDTVRRDLDTSGQMGALDRFTEKAWGILTSEEARAAFDLDREPARLRERYGFLPAFDPQAVDRCRAPHLAQRIL